MKSIPSRWHVRSGTTSWLAPRRVILPATASEHFLLGHFWLPLAAFALLSVVLMLGRVDLAIADQLYAWQGRRWALKSAFLTEHLIHLAGRDLSALVWLGVLGAWIVARSRPTLARWRRPLAYLLLATLFSTLLVAWIKSWSNMDCPWDLARYGGERPYIGLLAMRPVGLSRGACFPAGHASAGYCWLALYFFFLAARPRLRWTGLAVGIGAGLVFGFAQQLRGAHFLSHDVWTVTICWMTALGFYRLPWIRPQLMPMHAPAQAMAGTA